MTKGECETDQHQLKSFNSVMRGIKTIHLFHHLKLVCLSSLPSLDRFFLHDFLTWLPCDLQSLLADEQLASCPVLLLGNKIDIPGAASEDYIRQYFGLYGLTTGKVNNQCYKINMALLTSFL